MSKQRLNDFGVTKGQKIMNNQSCSNTPSRVFYSVEEVAEMFGISCKSVYRLLDRGLLKSSSALRHKMISRASIEEFTTTTTENGGVA